MFTSGLLAHELLCVVLLCKNAENIIWEGGTPVLSQVLLGRGGGGLGEGVPQDSNTPGQIWGTPWPGLGYPPARTVVPPVQDWGILPGQDWATPPPGLWYPLARTGVPPSGQNWVTPPPPDQNWGTPWDRLRCGRYVLVLEKQEDLFLVVSGKIFLCGEPMNDSSLRNRGSDTDDLI